MRISIVDQQHAQVLRTLIDSAPDYHIAWIAATAQEAFYRCLEDKPDLLLMALQLPDMDGIEATRHIMKYSPCPILLIASSLESCAGKIFAAMGEGAKDVINFSAQAQSDQEKHALLRKLRALATLHAPDSQKKHIEHTPKNKTSVQKPFVKVHKHDLPQLVAIGASTGGPHALVNLLQQLPSDLQAAVVIVQHLTEEFSFDLTAWLDTQSSLNVHLAIEGSQPRVGNVYIAHSDDHLVFDEHGSFLYTPHPQNIHYRPSVDVFFQSLAKHWCMPGVAVLLTGMGHDGAKGLAELKQNRWHTIAQDQKSSAVYGMPKAAKELGAALEILPLDKIGKAILQHC